MINLCQIIINGLIIGAIYSLVSSGFSLIYSTNKFIHFAHGAVISFSAYIFWMFFSSIHFSFFLSIFLALTFSGCLGWALNYFVYKSFRKKKSSGNIMLIVSFGILIFLESVIQIIFGARVKLINFDFLSKMIFIFGARVNYLQIITIFVSILCFIILFIFLNKTRLGKAVRAVSDNKDVAEIVGIDSEKIYSLSFVIGSLFAGIAGVLIGLNQALSISMERA